MRAQLLQEKRIEWEQRQVLEYYMNQAPVELFGVKIVRYNYVHLKTRNFSGHKI